MIIEATFETAPGVTVLERQLATALDELRRRTRERDEAREALREALAVLRGAERAPKAGGARAGC